MWSFYLIKNFFVIRLSQKGSLKMVKYEEVRLRTPNYHYRDCLQNILKDGIYTKNPHQDKGRYTLLTLPPMIFRLPNGFPVITERDISKFWKTPINELMAFINGVHTIEELEKWGCRWWNRWATPEKCEDFNLDPGDLGPGSYGVVFHDYPHFERIKAKWMPNGEYWVKKPFNQFENLIKQIKHSPYIATHKVTSWAPPFVIGHDERKRQVVVAPCHGDVEVTILNDKLTLRMDQRSGDFPIGVPANIIQYAALTIMIGQVTGFEPYMYIHQVHNAQIYENQISAVEEIIQRKTRHFPTLHLTEEGKKIKNLFDFRSHHFELRDYNPYPEINIPATI